MKTFLLLGILCCSTVVFSQTTITYPGNGNSNFGGAVGEGSLTITETDTSVAFSLKKGPGPFDSLIVFYVDVVPGGISSTAGLSGSGADRYLAAAAGHNPFFGRAVLNFPADFQPDAAVVFNKDSGKVFAFINIFGTFILPRDAFAVDSSATTYTGSGSKAKLAIKGPLNLKFIGTYIGESASRSAEAFGDPFINYSRPAGTTGYNPYTITSYFTFTSAVLPVRLVDFKAANSGTAVSIKWMVEDESSIDKYEVQRSADGISFSTIGTVKSRNAPGSSSYSFTDVSAQGGTNFYRLIIIERGRSEISKIVSLRLDEIKNSFMATSTSSNTLNLILKGVTPGIYKLSVLSNNGQLMYQEKLKVAGSYQNTPIQLNTNLNSGIYRVALQSVNAKYITNILVQ